MAYLTFNNGTTKKITAQEGIRLMLVKRGTKPGNEKLLKYLENVSSINFQREHELPRYRKPYKD